MHGAFSCEMCDDIFETKLDQARHMKSHQYTCDFCNKTFLNKAVLKQHIKEHLKKVWF